MNLYKKITFVLSAIALMCAAACASAELSKVEREFLDRRRAICYFEGMDLGEIVVGARGCMTFLYIDKRMGEALQARGTPADGSLPDMMSNHLLKYAGSYARRKGYVMFVVAVEAFKNWEIETSQIRVGGYSPKDEDFVTGVLGDPRYEISPGSNLLPPSYKGMFSFYVPASEVEPGSSVELGLGEYTTSWRVPGKNE